MNRRTLLWLSCAWLGAGISACASRGAQRTGTVAEDMYIDAADPGVQLFLRNRHAIEPVSAPPGRTVLFVHGLTYPGHTCFDLPLGGRSWMEDLAQRGFDTWCVDLRGYGRSTRPAAMEQPPEMNPPLLDAATGTRDLASAVDFICARRGLDRIVIVAWSWGTVLAARHAGRRPGQVERLVLYAPVWRWPGGPVPRAPAGAYRRVTREAARRTWVDGVPTGEQDALIPAGWFDQWADANWATDPLGVQANPPFLRAPNGPLVEVVAHWGEGRDFFTPSSIEAPTLLVVGAWDRTTPPAMARALDPLLTRAGKARLAVLPEGTHQLFLERRREALFVTVREFLEESA
ncbi:alpha/beta fold hydrolase [Variovorax sp. J22R24]|uniref:alpha/beta hydrolase n=1 Tax=Variovorax gracilis TaxID=3053502 RepID=UPI00257877FF|nr:alpha/beta fold hydrolase [Variovorax sp. J22R24]MDM0107266.1 alpha/beta fold hydrolase [Variovorax sp. J22R24]